jgi:hypothetical protein
MLTRKHLQALAVACGDVERETGADAHEVARIVVGALRASGGVTSGFDAGRFAAAVDDARPVPYRVA